MVLRPVAAAALGNLLKCNFSSLTSDILNQILWGGVQQSVFNKLSK